MGSNANSPVPVRHKTKALLRAHLAAATRYRHATRHCPVCHRLLRLAWEQGGQSGPVGQCDETFS